MLAVVALLAYGLVSRGPDTSIDSQLAAGKRPASPAAAFQPLAGGRPVSLGAYRGRVVVLNFWASWCTPCQDETPLLERWHKRLDSRRATVVGVDVLDVRGDAQAFTRKYGVTYPQLRDGDGSTLKRFDVVGYPETIVLDRSGRIAASARGPVDDRFFEKKVLPLTREQS